MRTVIFSDVHGNLTALEAALAAITQDAPDQIVCLGDVVVNGPQPHEALARVRELGCPVVMGNTDEWVLSPQPFTIRNERDQMLHDVELWGTQQLTEADQAFIRTFQPTIQLDLGYGRSLLCFHGSPRSNRETILATTPDSELADILGEPQATLLAGGHTHTPMLRRFQASFVLNPGSVGLPFLKKADGRIRNVAWAEYAIVTSENGRFDINLRHIPYSLDALRHAVTQSTHPHPEPFLADWIPGDIV